MYDGSRCIGVDCLYLYLLYKVYQNPDLETWSIQFHALFLYLQYQ